MATKGIWIPIEVLKDHSLTMQEKLVLMEISQLSDLESRQCYAGNEHFAKMLNVSKKSISNTVSNLVKKERITVELSDRNHSRLLSIKDGHPSIKDGHPSIKDGQSKDNKTINKTIKKKTHTFTPPTMDEIHIYYKEKNLDFNIDFFYEYFTASDWVDSTGKKVKSWKQKMLTWNNSEAKKKKATTQEHYSSKLGYIV